MARSLRAKNGTPRVGTRAVAALAGLATAGVLGLATASSAQAEVAVNMAQVCQNEYNQPQAKADMVDGSNPYTYYCYYWQESRTGGWLELTSTATKVSLGGADVQAYCNKFYYGLPATVQASTWTCGDGSENF